MRSLFSTLKDVNLTVVAPTAAHIPAWLKNVLADEEVYTDTIDDIQRFRGYVYVQDKAIPSSALDEQGRHNSEYDYYAWHIILRDRRQELCGAIRVGVVPYEEGGKPPDTLQILQYLARLPSERKDPMEEAVRQFLNTCHTLQPNICEPGAWAVAEDVRKGRLAPVLAASIWSLLRAVGGAAGVATATTRHQSADILRKMGGFELFRNGEALPPFYDPFHNCLIEIVGFDSGYLNPRLEATVAEVEAYINDLPIITRPAPVSEPAPTPSAHTPEPEDLI